ncbi:nucleoside-diphosphate sugar epimerase [Paenibacillus thermoaerophilus]|uniref:Nucleoside-diphosphate sugar epimerase n=1 Tax=Paenibacillus thermoaerophilus TaxID=1215385 RepID=A0ABW2V4Z5_9BACL|nr:nucleoside-diphosphate sugar epimerase [Paenibacillus thermoaerophilus]TMV17708.1 nucleoside-diphosphate sugar epimerase [Paenibacillus thermoaerophilus]
MQQRITDMIVHMTNSNRELARILEANAEIAVRMAQNIHAIPDRGHTFADPDTLAQNAMELTRSVTSYLNSLAALEEAMAEQLGPILKELADDDDE